MTEIIPFAFDDSLVRIIPRAGEPWFAAPDVARILGYRDAANATRGLDDDEKGTHILSTPGGPQEMTIISESGLYALIMNSRKPEAKRFRKWVTSEVLPSIRKSGRYEAEALAADEVTSIDPADMASALLNAQVGLVRACERLKGRAAANRLWAMLGLPDPGPDDPAAQPVRPVRTALEDPVALFAAEGVVEERGALTPTSELWAAFLRFCVARDLAVPARRAFETRFAQMGFAKRRVSLPGRRPMAYPGIRPLPPEPEDTP